MAPDEDISLFLQVLHDSSVSQAEKRKKTLRSVEDAVRALLLVSENKIK
jgi:hypothetical protein